MTNDQYKGMSHIMERQLCGRPARVDICLAYIHRVQGSTFDVNILFALRQSVDSNVVAGVLRTHPLVMNAFLCFTPTSRLLTAS